MRNKKVEEAISVLGHAANEADGAISAVGMSPCGHKWAVFALVAEPARVDAAVAAFEKASA